MTDNASARWTVSALSSARATGSRKARSDSSSVALSAGAAEDGRASVLQSGYVLTLHDEQRSQVLITIVLASLIATPQRVHIQHGSRATRIRTLDERNAEAAMRDPEGFRAQAGELLDTPDGSITIELLPYAIARVDVSM